MSVCERSNAEKDENPVFSAIPRMAILGEILWNYPNQIIELAVFYTISSLPSCSDDVAEEIIIEITFTFSEKVTINYRTI